MICGPNRDIPNFTGKVILVTSGNSSLDKESIIQLAKHHPQQILMGVRSKAKAARAIQEVRQIVPGANITFVEIDLSSFTSIRNAAKTVVQDNRLDMFINNAGLMGGCRPWTHRGWVRNPIWLKSYRPCVTHQAIHTFDAQDNFHWRGRCQDSAVEFLTSQTFTEERDIILSPDNTQKSSLFSWFIALGMKFLFTDVHTGALDQLWAAVGDPNEIKNGAYFVLLKKEIKGEPTVDDSDAAEKFWNWTEAVFKKHGIDSS